VGLGAYAALLRDAALVVANDTGPGHMAAAVGAPLLSVLGPTDPARWGAVGPTVHIMRQGTDGWPGLDAVAAQAQRLLAGT
jgi:heptosyltransferase-2